MLAKLLKYELKATARMFLPLYGALILFALINRLFILMDGRGGAAGISAGLSVLVFMMIVAAIGVLTIFVMIQRFYKSLLGDEGYLMFTLPVHSWEHITSKLLVSMLWVAASVAITSFSVYIMVYDAQVNNMISDLFYEITRYFSSVEMVLWGLFSLVCGVLMIYTAIALGHLLRKHRLLGAFGAFLGLCIVSQLLASILGTFLVRTEYASNQAALNTVSWSGIALLVILSAAYFITTNYILSRQLNLE